MDINNVDLIAVVIEVVNNNSYYRLCVDVHQAHFSEKGRIVPKENPA